MLDRYFQYCEKRGYAKGLRKAEDMLKKPPFTTNTPEENAADGKNFQRSHLYLSGFILIAGFVISCYLAYNIYAAGAASAFSWWDIASSLAIGTLVAALVGEFARGRGMGRGIAEGLAAGLPTDD